jgi:hypothetical protein
MKNENLEGNNNFLLSFFETKKEDKKKMVEGEEGL